MIQNDKLNRKCSSAHAQNAAEIAKTAPSSLFAAKPCDSYSNYKNEKGATVYPLRGSLKPLTFGSREVNFNHAGVRSLRQIPASGVHPRIFLTPPDLSAGSKIPDGQPMLLLRVLDAKGLGTPFVEENPNQSDSKRYSEVRHLVIPSDSVSPDLKILIYPHHQGAPLPVTQWDSSHAQLSINWDDQQDTAAFTNGTSGKTHLTLNRKGNNQPLISLTKEPVPLP